MDLAINYDVLAADAFSVQPLIAIVISAES